MPLYQFQIRSHSRKDDERGNTSQEYGAILWEEPRAQVHLTQPEILRWRVSLVQLKAEKLAKKLGRSVAVCSHPVNSLPSEYEVDTIVYPPSKEIPYASWQPRLIQGGLR